MASLSVAIPLDIVYAGCETLIGLLVGAACDYVFPHVVGSPDERFATNEEALMALLEVGAQITANTLVAMGVLAMVVNVGDAVADPAGGLAFSIAIQLAQPWLLKKVQKLITHVTWLFTQSYATTTMSGADVRVSDGMRDTKKVTSPGLTSSQMKADRYEVFGSAGAPSAVA